MFTPEYVSESEKIDRIYSMLRAERRARWIGLSIKLLLVGGIVYGYHYLSLPEHASVREKISASVQTEIAGIAVPIVNNMLQGMQAPAGQTGGTVVRRRSGAATTAQPAMPQITPEMIKAVQDSMKK